MDVKGYRDFIEFERSIIAYSLVENTFDDEPVPIEVVLDTPLKQLDFIVDPTFLQGIDLVRGVPALRVFQNALAFFPRKGPLRFDHYQ